VPASYRRHLDDLSLDQLDAVVLAEQAGLPHAVVFLRGEAVAPVEVCRRVDMAVGRVGLCVWSFAG